MFQRCVDQCVVVVEIDSTALTNSYHKARVLAGSLVCVHVGDLLDGIVGDRSLYHVSSLEQFVVKVVRLHSYAWFEVEETYLVEIDFVVDCFAHHQDTFLLLQRDEAMELAARLDRTKRRRIYFKGLVAVLVKLFPNIHKFNLIGALSKDNSFIDSYLLKG